MIRTLALTTALAMIAGSALAQYYSASSSAPTYAGPVTISNLTASRPVCATSAKALTTTCSLNAVLGVSPATTPSTAGTTPVMAGFGSAASAVFTPGTTGRVSFTISGSTQTATGAASVTLQIYYGTGTAPANAAALTGTPCGNATTPRMAGTSSAQAFSITCLVQGLTIGTAYWVDLTYATSNAADAATINASNVSAVEL